LIRIEEIRFDIKILHSIRFDFQHIIKDSIRILICLRYLVHISLKPCIHDARNQFQNSDGERID